MVNPDRVRRFEREARAASALNHPNIVTIYEIGNSNTAHFIATEFVDGKTLRQLINEKPFTLNETLNVCIQVADALSGAHAAGIVHRDIKPENIMIRRDGYVKILDFGLAKLNEQQATDADLETPTLLQTNPGLVMGTVQYMSPEQARAKNVGVGTDIWSLGIVMYELLAGHVPFSGETPSHVMVSLMEDKLPPLRASASVPEELDRFVAKALHKNQKERYRAAGELARDLKNLKQKLQRDSALNKWLETIPSQKDGLPLPPLSLTAVSGAHKEPRENRAAETTPVESHPTSTAEYLTGEIKGNKKAVAVAAVLIAAVVIIEIGGLFAFRYYRSKAESPKPSARPSNMKITRLTTNGRTQSAAISPDGKTVVYVMREGALLSLWIRQVGTTNNIQVVPPANMQIGQETFSPDSNYIYYQARDKQNPEGILWQVPTLGGLPRKITSHINSPIAFSPDGSRFAFIRNDIAAAGENQLMIANADGSNEKKLAVRKGDAFFAVSGLSWSPDGKLLGCAAGSYAAGFHSAVVTVDVATGEQKEITNKRFTEIGRVSWLSDRSGMLVSATEQGANQNQIWLIPYPSDDAQRVTHDLTDYNGTSLTADSRSLVTVGYDVTANVWMAPVNDLMRGKQITIGKLEGTEGLAWTPGGRIVYSSIAGGTFDLWIMNADGTNKKQLTSDEATEYEPHVSPDGRYIVFSSSRGKLPGVWRMDIDGRNLKQLTDGEDYLTAITPDGKSILFTSWRTTKMSPWRVSIDGGEPVQISNLFIVSAAIAPDGKSLVCLNQDENRSQPHHLIVMPIEGGAPTKSFDLLPTTTAGTPEFAPDGKSVTVYDSRTGAQNLWSFSLDGSPMKQLTDFKPDSLFYRQLSFDGKWMAMSRGVTTSDVILISDFR
jgi:serine/threonine protein kinase